MGPEISSHYGGTNVWKCHLKSWDFTYLLTYYFTTTSRAQSQDSRRITLTLLKARTDVFRNNFFCLFNACIVDLIWGLFERFEKVFWPSERTPPLFKLPPKCSDSCVFGAERSSLSSAIFRSVRWHGMPGDAETGESLSTVTGLVLALMEPGFFLLWTWRSNSNNNLFQNTRHRYYMNMQLWT